MNFKRLPILTVLLLTLQPALGEDLVFAPTHDAFTQNGGNRNLNELRVESSNRKRITYLQFDLSSLATAPFSAVLTLTGGSDRSSGDMTIRIFGGASSDWMEADIDGDSAPERGAEVSVFEGDIQIGQVVEFDVTSLIETPGVYTLIVEADDSPLDVSFVSKEGEVVEEQPFLSVVALPPSDPNVLVSSTADFGSLPILDTDQPVEFRILNTGDTEILTLSDYALGGADADHFTIVGAPDSISPKDEGLVELIFNGKQELGGFNASLSFTTNDPDAEEQSISVNLVAVVPNPDGPIAHYRLDESAGSVDAVDSTGNGNLAVFDGGTTLGVAGLNEGSATAIALDGSGVMERQAAFPLDSFTISLWFQTNDLGDAESFDLRTLVGQGETNPAAGLLLGSGDLIWFADTDFAFRTTDAPVEVGEVYHVAMRYEGNGDTGMASILLDGVEVASGEIDAPIAEGFFYAGSFGSERSLGFNGVIDDVQFYSRALNTDSEIAFLAATPGQVISPVALGQDPDSDGDGLSDKDEVAIHQTDPRNPDSDGDGLLDGDEVERTSNPLSTDTDGDRFSDSVEVANGFDPTDPDVPVVGELLAGVGEAVIAYDFNEGAGTTIGNHGSGNDGSLENAHGAAWVNEGGLDGSGYLNFTQAGATGADSQYITTGLDASEINIAEGPYTMTAWVRADTVSPGGNSQDHMIFGQLEEGNVLHNGLRGSNFHIGHWGNDTSGGTVMVGEWQHVAFRFEEGTQTIFVNGSPEAELAEKGGVAVESEIVIGTTRADQDRDFSGDLDDVRVFNEALTDIQIAAIAANGSPGGDMVDDSLIVIQDVFRSSDGVLSFFVPEGMTVDIEHSFDLKAWSIIATSVVVAFSDSNADRNAAASGYYRGVVK